MAGWRHTPQSGNINLFLSPYLQLSFIYLSSCCWSNGLIRGAVKLIHFLAAGGRQLGSEESQQSGWYNCGVIIFMQLLGFFLDCKQCFRSTCHGNKATINSASDPRISEPSHPAFIKHAILCRFLTQRESSNTHSHAQYLKNVKCKVLSEVPNGSNVLRTLDLPSQNRLFSVC